MLSYRIFTHVDILVHRSIQAIPLLLSVHNSDTDTTVMRLRSANFQYTPTKHVTRAPIETAPSRKLYTVTDRFDLTRPDSVSIKRTPTLRNKCRFLSSDVHVLGLPQNGHEDRITPSYRQTGHESNYQNNFSFHPSMSHTLTKLTSRNLHIHRRRLSISWTTISASMLFDYFAHRRTW